MYITNLNLDNTKDTIIIITPFTLSNDLKILLDNIVKHCNKNVIISNTLYNNKYAGKFDIDKLYSKDDNSIVNTEYTILLFGFIIDITKDYEKENLMYLNVIEKKMSKCKLYYIPSLIEGLYTLKELNNYMDIKVSYEYIYPIDIFEFDNSLSDFYEYMKYSYVYSPYKKLYKPYLQLLKKGYNYINESYKEKIVYNLDKII